MFEEVLRGYQRSCRDISRYQGGTSAIIKRYHGDTFDFVSNVVPGGYRRLSRYCYCDHKLTWLLMEDPGPKVKGQTSDIPETKYRSNNFCAFFFFS